MVSVEDDLRIIAEQEEKLVLERIDEDVAAGIGAYVRERGNAIGKGLVVAVYLWDRTLFYGATAGSTGANEPWVKRKTQTVRLFHKSSYRVVLERGDKPRIIEPQWALGPEAYALAGGAFPIRIKGAGIVGTVAVSGLHERDDHEFARAAIAHSLGLGADAYALPPLG